MSPLLSGQGVNSMEDWEKGGQDVDTQQVGFNVIGDFIKGTYTGKKWVESKEQFLYELKGIVGTFHVMDDNKKVVEKPVTVAPGAYYNIWGKPKGREGNVDALFKKSAFGDIVAVQFKEETPATKKGNHPFKIFKTKAFGRDKDYMGEDASAVAEVFPGAEEVE